MPPSPSLNAAGSTPPTLLCRLTLITDRLDLAQLFPKAQPLEVGLGSGDGSFLVSLARLRPERNFIGVERLLGRIRKMDRKGLRAGLANLRGLRIESGYCLEYLLPPNSVSALHLSFPDPWPKRKHWRRRLVNERFPGVAAQALAPGGVVYLRTDHAEDCAQMREVFAASAAFRPTDTPAELSAMLTDFERDFQAQGIQILHAAYAKGA